MAPESSTMIAFASASTTLCSMAALCFGPKLDDDRAVLR